MGIWICWKYFMEIFMEIMWVGSSIYLTPNKYCQQGNIIIIVRGLPCLYYKKISKRNKIFHWHEYGLHSF